MSKEIVLAKGLSFPIGIPFSISKTDNSVTITSTGFKFPLSVPFTLSEKQEAVKPPVSFSTGNIEEGSNGRKKIIKKYNVTEKAWVFQGVVFEENVVSLMKTQVLLLEEVKGRILVDLILIDKNHIKLKWYGSEVETIQVFKKLDIDEKYETDGDPIPWEIGSTTIAVSDSSYNIILKGPYGSGESGVINLADTSADAIINDLKIALNEKTYFLTADFKETYVLNINF